MEIGMIGLGRMGGNMAQRLARGGHHVIGYDPNEDARREFDKKGIASAASLEALLGELKAPRAIWLMIPSGTPVDEMLVRLLPLLTPQDAIIDGGNSYYKDTQNRARMLSKHGIAYVDVGTSGGI